MISCNVTKDLLPLYHDGICSEDSRALVEAHVANCPACRAVLRELRGEIEIPHESPDDLGAMKKLEDHVKKGNKRAWIRGAAAVLALVILLFAAAAGWRSLEQNRYQDICMRFAEGQERIDNGDSVYPYPCDYEWVHGNYLFRVTLPDDDNRHGTVELREFKWTKDISLPDDEVVFSMEIGFADDGDYIYTIGFENTGFTLSSDIEDGDWIYEYIRLDTNGLLLYDEEWDEETIARKDAFVEEYRTEILHIITAAEREWPFLAE